MLCPIYKWMISRAMDSGKPISGMVARHVRGCSSCREFARLSEELERRLTKDAAVLLESADIAPGEKMRSLLGTRPDSSSRARHSRLRPVFAAAASLAVVSVSIIWLTTSRPNKMPPLGSFFKFEAPGVYLDRALQKAQSPYQQEILELKQALKSTNGVLEACFDIGLGEKKK
jgi:hypothetical protein